MKKILKSFLFIFLSLIILSPSVFATDTEYFSNDPRLRSRINKEIRNKLVPYVNIDLIEDIANREVRTTYPQRYFFSNINLFILALTPRLVQKGPLSAAEIDTIINNLEMKDEYYRPYTKEQLEIANRALTQDIQILRETAQRMSMDNPTFFYSKAGRLLYSPIIIKTYGRRHAVALFYEAFIPYLRKNEAFSEGNKEFIIQSLDVNQENKDYLSLFMNFLNDYPLSH